MSIIFGTDGWRGLIGEDINENTTAVVAQAFADYLKGSINSPAIVIGYDNRNFSESFARTFAEVISGNGIKVFLSDKIIPTPVVTYYVKSMNLDAGVMITASHNPPKYNGIKFKSKYGAPFFTEETQKVEQLLYKSTIKKTTNLIEVCDLFENYKSAALKLIDINSISNSNIKILVDSMGGAGCRYLELILKDICKIDTIFGDPSPNFHNRFAEPIEKNLVPLSEKLKSTNYALGTANDGDADRIGVLTDSGEWLSAQETILLISDYLINTKNLNGNIVKTSSVTDKLISNFSHKLKVFDVQVGFKYIAEKMIEDNITFGCEESGGYGYGFHMPERDGLFSTLVLLEMLAKNKVTKLSEYVKLKREEFGMIFYDRIDYHYEKENRTEILPNLIKSNLSQIANFSVKETNSFYGSRGIINGIKYKLEGETRWLLLRASETEPLVRIYAEAESNEEVKILLNKGINIING
jgi:phosphomannomutase